MTTYTVSIDEKSKEGKALIARLKSSSGVVGVWRKNPSTLNRKLKSRKLTHVNEAKDDEVLGMVMEKEETGKLISKRTVMKALKAVK